MKTTPIQLAREKMSQYGLPALTDAELLAIVKYKGTTEEYYSSPEFRASKELFRRWEKPEEQKITSSKNAADLLSFLVHETEEHFYALFLNQRNKVLKMEFISKGTATGTVVNIQQIARKALEYKAQGVILSHNHPSGDIIPSDADRKLTDKVNMALQLFDIRLLDHVIIAQSGYYSFADEGKI